MFNNYTKLKITGDKEKSLWLLFYKLWVRLKMRRLPNK